MEAAGCIDQSEIAAREANEVAMFLFDEADCLARQCFADEDVLAMPLDRAVPADTANLVIGIVPGLLDTSRQDAARCPSRSW